jgi:hypothetical protein
MFYLLLSFAPRSHFISCTYAVPTRTLRSSSMASTTHSNSNSNSEPDGERNETSSTPRITSSTSTTPMPKEKELLALPEAPAHESSTTTLDVSNGGTTIKLDHLGPMVVNVDGSLSRISNWEGLADIEKKNTLRIIAKRNQMRLEALRK